MEKNMYLPLRKKCPYLELLWSAFSRIPTEYGEIRNISPYSVRIRENADQNNSKYGQFLRTYVNAYLNNINILFLSVTLYRNSRQKNFY